MINWLKMVFHCHKWKTTKIVELAIYHELGKKGDPSTGLRYYQECEICGKLRKVDLA